MTITQEHATGLSNPARRERLLLDLVDANRFTAITGVQLTEEGDIYGGSLSDADKAALWAVRGWMQFTDRSGTTYSNPHGGADQCADLGLAAEPTNALCQLLKSAVRHQPHATVLKEVIQYQRELIRRAHPDPVYVP